MSSEIILFDLPSRGDSPHCWSLNPWKARASLNYKGIPYKTEWIEYPDIASACKKLDIQPNDGTTSYAEYSCPFAKFPDGTYIMDSRKIAEELEKSQPEPSLHMDKGEVIDKVQATVLQITVNLAAIAMPRVPEKLLNPRSAEYFHTTRAKRFGMPLPEFAKSEKAGETAWKNAEEHLRKLEAILQEDKGGPYVLGAEPSFADLIIGGFWMFYKELDEGGDLFDRGMQYSKAFPEHFKAVQKWFEKDD